jgi:hypothetical protein
MDHITVADVCIHNPENNVNNKELAPEDAHCCMMMTKQYELMLVN